MHARHAHRGAGRDASRRPGSTPTTTTSTRAASTTDRSSRRARSTTACARSRTCARRASRCAPAASSAWARAPTTAARCCARSRTSIRSPRACPINALVRVAGTPLADLPPVDPLELVRMIARRAHPHAAGARAPLARGAPSSRARRRCSCMLRGRQLDLLRRQAPHDAEPGRGRGPRAPPRRRPRADGARAVASASGGAARLEHEDARRRGRACRRGRRSPSSWS